MPPKAKQSSEAKPPVCRSLATTVLLTILVVLIWAQLVNFHPACLLNSAAATLTKALTADDIGSAPQIEDLVWFVPRPDKPRIVGWEDDWMIQFKNKHYSQNQTLDLVPSKEHPYGQDVVVCNIPAYVPARWPVTSPQRISRVIFLSWRTRILNVQACMAIKMILNHHPEYELVFMDDNIIDQFVCDNYAANAPNFGQLRAGAARCDAWRMLVIYRYGGVYFDLDMTSTSHLRIPANASVYSGIGGWTHLPNDNGIEGGILEHWALAYEPKHNLIAKTVELIWWNLNNPKNEFLWGEKYIENEDSLTMRLTGPSVYQRALRHLILTKSSCRGSIMLDMLKNPEEYCNMTAFREEFGELVVVTPIPMGLALIEKKLEAKVYWPGSGNDYDGEDQMYYSDPQPKFCQTVDVRVAEREKEWTDAIKINKEEVKKAQKPPDSYDENSGDENSGDQNSGDENDEDGKDKDGSNDNGNEDEENNSNDENDDKDEDRANSNDEKKEDADKASRDNSAQKDEEEERLKKEEEDQPKEDLQDRKNNTSVAKQKVEEAKKKAAVKKADEQAKVMEAKQVEADDVKKEGNAMKPESKPIEVKTVQQAEKKSGETLDWKKDQQAVMEKVEEGRKNVDKVQVNKGGAEKGEITKDGAQLDGKLKAEQERKKRQGQEKWLKMKDEEHQRQKNEKNGKRAEKSELKAPTVNAKPGEDGQTIEAAKITKQDGKEAKKTEPKAPTVDEK